MDGLRARVALLLFTLSSARAGPARRTVRPGDDVTLPCDVRHESRTLWVAHRRGEPPFLWVSVQERTGGSRGLLSFSAGSDPRLSAELDPANRTFSLTVANASERDLGLYYCASSLRLGGATWLGFAAESRPPAAAPPDCPGYCPACWASLAGLAGVSVLLALGGTAWVHRLRRRAGDASPEDRRGRREDAGSGDAGATDYAAVEVPVLRGRPRPGPAPPPPGLYSEISCLPGEGGRV
ncbi:uncharacterized protein [Lepisosteus oculatus]|uniref:uncharacterized protein n=1 Tax=Lepisosteus oculatus TaxID=7918 RepID=UPI0035F52C52